MGSQELSTKKIGRPQTGAGIQQHVMFRPETMALIDVFAAQQVPSLEGYGARHEAIRRLVSLGLRHPTEGVKTGSE